MQDVTPQLTRGAQRIESYGPAGFRISGVAYAASVLVAAEHSQAWAVTRLEGITLESLMPVIDCVPPLEVLLIGTGARHAMLPPELRAQIRARGIGVDSMDTGAACRTFNILLSESRRVAAALLLP